MCEMTAQRIVCYDRSCQRLWLLGQRVHHGGVGIGLVALGLVLAVHDRADRHEWFHRAKLILPSSPTT